MSAFHSAAGGPRFRSTNAEIRFEGKVIRCGVERFRYDDGGEEVSREKVWHPGAVGVLAVDATHVWLTRQPREVIGEPGSLEIPAGKLDVEGEAPLATAQRELAEEIGRRAEHWEEIFVFFTSPGFSDERVWLYLATGLAETAEVEPDASERIHILPWPLAELDAAIAACEDSKSLIALLWLKARRS